MVKEKEEAPRKSSPSLIFQDGVGETEAAEKAVLGLVWSEVLFQQPCFYIHSCAMPSDFYRCCCMVV